MNIKKILLIILFVFLVLAFGALIYFVFIADLFGPGVNNENVNGVVNENVNGVLPTINTAANINLEPTPTNVNGLTNAFYPTNVNRAVVDDVASGGETLARAVVDNRVQSAEASVDGHSLRYYDKIEGKFFELDQDGKPRELTDLTFPEAKEISWSPKDDKALISFPDGSNIMYDFDTREQVTLPREWDDLQFSPTGERIAFKNIDDEERARWLAVSNPDGSEITLVEPLGDKANDVAVNWSPSGQVVALFREGYSGTSQEVYLIGLHGENFKSLITDGRGFEGIWSTDGSQLLYSIYNADSRYNPILYIADAVGDTVGANEMNLGLQTWASRCTFSNLESFAYCAVPQYLPTGSGLYPELAEDTNDSIRKINLNTGSSTVLALPNFTGRDYGYSIESLFLSDDGVYLYFTESKSGRLFEIRLK